MPEIPIEGIVVTEAALKLGHCPLSQLDIVSRDQTITPTIEERFWLSENFMNVILNSLSLCGTCLDLWSELDPSCLGACVFLGVVMHDAGHDEYRLNAISSPTHFAICTH